MIPSVEKVFLEILLVHNSPGLFFVLHSFTIRPASVTVLLVAGKGLPRTGILCFERGKEINVTTGE